MMHNMHVSNKLHEMKNAHDELFTATNKSITAKIKKPLIGLQTLTRPADFGSNWPNDSLHRPGQSLESKFKLLVRNECLKHVCTHACGETGVRTLYLFDIVACLCTRFNKQNIHLFRSLFSFLCSNLSVSPHRHRTPP